MLQKTTRINILYDFYHPLLTNKQMEYMELYYREDYSLSEIAQNNNVSRQAVYDTIKRTEQLLEMYEKKLQLFNKFTERNEILGDLKQSICKDNPNIDTILALIDKLQRTE